MKSLTRALFPALSVILIYKVQDVLTSENLTALRMKIFGYAGAKHDLPLECVFVYKNINAHALKCMYVLAKEQNQCPL